MDIIGTPRRAPTLSIGLRVRVLHNAAGAGAAPFSRIRSHIANANQIWQPAGVAFRTDLLTTWSRAKYFNVDRRTEFDDLEAERWDRGNSWIGVYYVNSIEVNGIKAAGICSFPHTREPHAIVMDDDASNSTLAHELGHYLNLAHTFDDDLGDTFSTEPGDPQNVMSYQRTTTIANIHLTVSQIRRARESAFNDRSIMIAPTIWAAIG